MSHCSFVSNGWSFYFLLTVLVGFVAPLQVIAESAERLILSEDFEGGLDLWRVEDRGGHHLVELSDGRLIVRNLVPTPGVFVWSRVELPASFRLEFDFTADAGFKDVYLEGIEGGVAIWGRHLGKLRYGHFKEPFSLERQMSSNHHGFLEWSLPVATFAPGRNAALSLTATF